jgi:hypothetical protein
MRKISKMLTKIYRTWPYYGMRLVFEILGGSDDFIMQKVYLRRNRQAVGQGVITYLLITDLSIYRKEDVLFQLTIRGASENFKNQPRPRSVNLHQHFRNQSRKTVP